MNVIRMAEGRVDREVDRLFRDNPPRYGQLCRNPVTGSGYVGGLDPIEPQKRTARLALLAREHFALNGPPDGQPLPLLCWEIEDRKYALHLKARVPLSYIVSCYAHSLADADYDLNRHPSFEDFASGVLASEHAPEFVREDETLRKRYPPRRLRFLSAGCFWCPPDRAAA